MGLAERCTIISENLRKQLFPIHIAANKSDMALSDSSEANANGIIIPSTADMELHLAEPLRDDRLSVRLKRVFNFNEASLTKAT